MFGTNVAVLMLVNGISAVRDMLTVATTSEDSDGVSKTVFAVPNHDARFSLTAKMTSRPVYKAEIQNAIHRKVEIGIDCERSDECHCRIHFGWEIKACTLPVAETKLRSNDQCFVSVSYNLPIKTNKNKDTVSCHVVQESSVDSSIDLLKNYTPSIPGGTPIFIVPNTHQVWRINLKAMIPSVRPTHFTEPLPMSIGCTTDGDCDCVLEILSEKDPKIIPCQIGRRSSGMMSGIIPTTPRDQLQNCHVQIDPFAILTMGSELSKDVCFPVFMDIKYLPKTLSTMHVEERGAPVIIPTSTGTVIQYSTLDLAIKGYDSHHAACSRYCECSLQSKSIKGGGIFKKDTYDTITSLAYCDGHATKEMDECPLNIVHTDGNLSCYL